MNRVVIAAFLLGCHGSDSDTEAAHDPVLSFAAPSTTATGGAQALVAADVDGDGNADLITNTTSAVQVFLGAGDGTFTAGPVTSAPSTRGLAVADFDGDGDVDAAVEGYEGTTSVLSGAGDGTFVGQTVPGSGWSVVAADVDEDGDSDLVAPVSSAESVVDVLLGDGHGGFATPTAWPTGGLDPEYAAVGDTDGDGNADLVITDWMTAGLYVLPGAGDGTFGAATHLELSGTVFRRVWIGDLYDDGSTRIVASSPVAAEIDIVAPGGEAIVIAMDHPTAGLGVMDFDGDGWLDIGTMDVATGELVVLSGDGSGGLAEAQRFPLGEPTSFIDVAEAVVFADVTGDGLPDAVASAPSAFHVAVGTSQ